jgi:hypothetical protein
MSMNVYTTYIHVCMNKCVWICEFLHICETCLAGCFIEHWSYVILFKVHICIYYIQTCVHQWMCIIMCVCVYIRDTSYGFCYWVSSHVIVPKVRIYISKYIYLYIYMYVLYMYIYIYVYAYLCAEYTRYVLRVVL